MPRRTASVAYESTRGSRAKDKYLGEVHRALVALGRTDSEASSCIERSHDQIVRAQRVGVDAKTEAAIIDATLHHSHPHRAEMQEMVREAVRAMESPTREEWEVLVRGLSAKASDEITTIYPKAQVIAPGSVLIRGIYDDEKASGVARAITHKYGAMVTSGPRSMMAAETGGFGDRSAMGEGQVYEARDSGTSGPFTQIHRDPGRFAQVKERADRIGPLKSDRSLYDLLSPDLEQETQEVFYVVTVDVHGQLLEYAEVARGQTDRVAVTPREIFPVVLLSKASGFAVAHNHPSGSAKPSGADRELTNRLTRATEVICPEVPFLDHLVVTGSEYYSFRSKKLVKVKRSKRPVE